MPTVTLFAQNNAPDIQWYNSYWPDEDLCGIEEEDIELSKTKSGEDWFYDVIVSKNNAGIEEELIAVGYQGALVNHNNPLACQTENPNFDYYFYSLFRDKNGSTLLKYYKEGTIWGIDKKGHTLWYVDLQKV